MFFFWPEFAAFHHSTVALLRVETRGIFIGNVCARFILPSVFCFASLRYQVNISIKEPVYGETVVEFVHSLLPESDKFGKHGVRDRVLEGWEKFFWLRWEKMLGWARLPTVNPDVDELVKS